jgi:hypothetical protein
MQRGDLADVRVENVDAAVCHGGVLRGMGTGKMRSIGGLIRILVFVFGVD